MPVQLNRHVRQIYSLSYVRFRRTGFHPSGQAQGHAFPGHALAHSGQMVSGCALKDLLAGTRLESAREGAAGIAAIDLFGSIDSGRGKSRMPGRARAFRRPQTAADQRSISPK